MPTWCLCILMLTAPLPGFQIQPQARATSRRTPPPTSARKTDEAARKLLEQAARVQLPGGEDLVLRGFEAHLDLRVLRQDQNQARSRVNSGQVTWRYQLRLPHQPEAYLRHLVSPTGDEVWLTQYRGTRLLQEKNRPPVDLNDPSFEKDRKGLADELQQVRQLAHLLLLKDLLQKEAAITFGKPQVTIPSGRGKVSCLEIKRSRQKEADLSIFLGVKDHYLYQVIRQPQNPRDKTQTFRFSYHQYRAPLEGTRESFTRILLPRKVEFLEDGKLTMTATARRAQDLILNPRFNRTTSFRPPTPRRR